MKKTFLTLTTAILFSGCQSTTAVYEKTAQLKYPNVLQKESVIKTSYTYIPTLLKDPDSLKVLDVNSYKCYASNMDLSDNISPKYGFGYWCHFVTYTATNSYGGRVRGTEIFVQNKQTLATVNQLGEVVRKADDVYTTFAPTN